MKVPGSVKILTTSQRLAAFQYIATLQEWNLARENEALMYAISWSSNMYHDKLQQLIYNLRTNKELRTRSDLALLDDVELSKGTVIEDITRERKEQIERFNNILQEKYELASRSNTTTLRCRRCGGTDIHAEQKQTRGADEAMTVFCTCARCTLRWTMR